MQERTTQLVVSDLEARLEAQKQRYHALSEDRRLLVPDVEECFGCIAERIRRTSEGERGWLAWNSGLALAKLHELEQLIGEAEQPPIAQECEDGECSQEVAV
jgi:hypothetical protein